MSDSSLISDQQSIQPDLENSGVGLLTYKMKMDFLEGEDWSMNEIEIDLTMFVQNEAENQEYFNTMSGNQSMIVSRKWCKRVLVEVEERDSDGTLIFPKLALSCYRKWIKLNGSTNVWVDCIEQMKVNQTCWFKLGPKYVLRSKFRYLKITILEAESKFDPFGQFSLVNTDHFQRVLYHKESQTEIISNFKSLLANVEQLKLTAQKLQESHLEEVKQNNLASACTLFKKAFKRILNIQRYLLPKREREIQLQYLNEYGANYVCCLIRLQQFQKALIFLTNHINWLHQSKNLYLLALCLSKSSQPQKSLIIIEAAKKEIDLILANHKIEKELAPNSSNSLLSSGSPPLSPLTVSPRNTSTNLNLEISLNAIYEPEQNLSQYVKIREKLISLKAICERDIDLDFKK